MEGVIGVGRLDTKAQEARKVLIYLHAFLLIAFEDCPGVVSHFRSVWMAHRQVSAAMDVLHVG